MTTRALGILLASAVLIALGWGLRWPELTGMGTAGVALLAAVVATHLRTPKAQLSCDRMSLRTARDHPLQLELGTDVTRGGRSLRLVVGDADDPTITLPLPGSAAPRGHISVPVDTSRRGQFTLGPYLLVHGDPWGLVRRVVDDVRGGVVLVHPRVTHLRRSPFSAALVSESDAASRRQGHDHFHALREYVLGDEPRSVHWRSSARAGKLVVRQEVAAASSGTAVVLDTDATAYGSDQAFGAGWDTARFEAAVEVAASIAVAQTTSAEKVHVVTTTRASTLTTAESGAAGALLDLLAVTAAVPPVDSVPEETLSLLRRARCSRVVLVTGTPGQRTTRSAQALARLVPSTVVVRVGARQAPPIPGVKVIDVETVDDLR